LSLESIIGTLAFKPTEFNYHFTKITNYWQLIVTMDDATSEHYAMFFVEEEGTASSFAGVKEVVESRGWFSSLYKDRGGHYWHTPGGGR
jgi:hypothetical protein